MQYLETLDIIYRWEIKELWELFRLICKEHSHLDKEYLRVMIGNNKFPIHIQTINNEDFKIFPERRIVFFKGFGNYDLIHFYQEVEDRKDIMRNIIREMNEKHEVDIARGGKL